MEPSKTGRRIFRRHRWLLLDLTILPVAAVVSVNEHQSVIYTAAATDQGDGTIPGATTEVSAIQNKVSAVAADPP